MRRTTTLTTLIGLVLPLGMAAPASAAETCDGKAATIVARPGVPTTGTPGDDVIVGTSAPDTIDGAEGNDTICGLAGEDEIDGGAGNDRLFGGEDRYEPDDGYWGDNIAPGPGDDFVDLGHDPAAERIYDVDPGWWDQVSFKDSAQPVTVDLAAGTATGEGTDTIVVPTYSGGVEGSAFNDHITGSDVQDWIAAGAGDDTILAGQGDDRVRADGLSDFFADVSPGNDIVFTGPGRDEVRGGHGADTIDAGEGRDTVYAFAASGGMATGGTGNDELWGSGPITLVGGTGADTFFPQIDSWDTITVRGSAGRDVLRPDMDLSVVPHRSKLLVGRPAGTLRVLPRGTKQFHTVVRFSSVPVFRPNSIASSLGITWFGTAGPDRLDLDMHEGRVHAFGRGGADDVRTGTAADLLDGGAGRDVLNGDLGRDRCLHGERLTSCEVRR